MNILNCKFIKFVKYTIEPSSSIIRTIETLTTEIEEQEWSQCRPYAEIPGPKPIPFLGNTWRFIPYIGIHWFAINRLNNIQKIWWENTEIQFRPCCITIALTNLFKLVLRRFLYILNVQDAFISGNFEIQAVDQVSKKLYKEYGDIVKIEGLLGRPDMVFIYDANEIERIFRQEERMPYRPSMPSLNYYKHVLRKEFFKNNAGVIAV